MVDENLLMRMRAMISYAVQIPLWSMKTLEEQGITECRINVQIPLWSMKTQYRRPGS